MSDDLKITISGPAASGKTRTLNIIMEALSNAGFVFSYDHDKHTLTLKSCKSMPQIIKELRSSSK